MATIAEIVDEWFQGEPTPERQQNMRRATLVRDLEALFAQRLTALVEEVEALKDLPSVVNAHARVALDAAADRVRRVAPR